MAVILQLRKSIGVGVIKKYFRRHGQTRQRLMKEWKFWNRKLLLLTLRWQEILSSRSCPRPKTGNWLREVIDDSFWEYWPESKVYLEAILFKMMKSGIVPQLKQTQTHVYSEHRSSRRLWSSLFLSQQFKSKPLVSARPFRITSKLSYSKMVYNFSRKKNLLASHLS